MAKKNKPKYTKKSTQAEVYQRVKHVQEQLIGGHSTTDIVRKCMSQWKIEKRQAYRYLKDAFELFVKETQNDISERKAFHIQSRMKLYRDAMSGKQTSIALAILDSISKLEGLLVQKSELTLNGGAVIKITNKNKKP